MEHKEKHGGHQEKEGKNEGGNLEGETNHEKLWTLGNKLRGSEGRGVGE